MRACLAFHHLRSRSPKYARMQCTKGLGHSTPEPALVRSIYGSLYSACPRKATHAAIHAGSRFASAIDQALCTYSRELVKGLPLRRHHYKSTASNVLTSWGSFAYL